MLHSLMLIRLLIFQMDLVVVVWRRTQKKCWEVIAPWGVFFIIFSINIEEFLVFLHCWCMLQTND